MQMSDNPVVALNHAVAVAMVRGPRAGLDLLGRLGADERMSADHRLHAVSAYLLEMAGDRAAARESYLAAARRAGNLPQQRYLHARAARLAGDLYAAVMAGKPRRARVEDVHQLAMRMPHVSVLHGPHGNPIYQVGGKSFIFFRNPRPDAVDPETGERYADVIMFWVGSEADKQALVQDQASPFFTTAHFDGHPSVLLRACRVGELTVQELAEVIQDAWLFRASPARAAAWLNAHPGG